MTESCIRNLFLNKIIGISENLGKNRRKKLRKTYGKSHKTGANLRKPIFLYVKPLKTQFACWVHRIYARYLLRCRVDRCFSTKHLPDYVVAYTLLMSKTNLSQILAVRSGFGVPSYWI